LYRIAGFVRNEGEETHEGIGVVVTFFDDEGYRHGPLRANCPCILLAPDEECPFAIETAVRRPVSFLLHPEGRTTGRESATVELVEVQVEDDGWGSIRFTGRAVNPHPFKIKDIVVIGTLIDAEGRMVQMGSTWVLREDIAPGGGAPFDFRVERAPSDAYDLYARAERDWQ
jgi:hypothetical protein